jgi:RNA polymerase sigma-70 factor (ECF subfamily)
VTQAARPPGERELLAQARAGRKDALEALLERQEGRVLRFARRLCRHREDAEDVLQESLLAAARGLSRFRGEASISTWLFAIARSFCIKKRRRSVFAPVTLSLEGEARVAARSVRSPDRSPHQALEARRLEAALDQAIAALPRPYREVLLLRDVEGLSAAEVGEVTGLSVPAVKTRLHRARERVRARLSPLFAASGAPQAVARPCPDVVRLFSRHLEGDISPRTCARMEEHLASCPRCRTACDSLKSVLATCRALPEPQVPASLREKLRESLHEALGAGS